MNRENYRIILVISFVALLTIVSLSTSFHFGAGLALVGIMCGILLGTLCITELFRNRELESYIHNIAELVETSDKNDN